MKLIRKISVDKPFLTVAVTLLLTAFLAFGIKTFVIDDDFFKMFPKNMESRLLWEDMVDEFGDSEFLFVAFGKENQNIYNLETIETVRTLTSTFENIDMVDEVISLTTIQKIEIDPEDSEMIVTENLFYKEAVDLIELDSARIYLNKHLDIKNRLISNNEKFTAIAIRATVLNEDGSYRNNTDFMNSISPIVKDHLIDKGYQVHYAGNPYITGEVPNVIRSDASTLILIGLLIMIFLLYINIRNLKAVAMILMVIVLSLISMNGFMGWMFYLTGNVIFNFTIINTSMPIVLLTIANSDGVHVVTRFFKELRKSSNKKSAIKKTMESLGLPIFLTSITTIFAFLSMIYSPIPQMMGYGMVISFGIFWAWLLSNTLLPSLLLTLNWEPNSKAISKVGYIEKIMNRIGTKIFNRPKQFFGIGMLFVLIGFVGVWNVKVEVNIIKFFKEGNSIRESTEFVDDNFAGTMSLLMRINADMQSPQTLNTISRIQDHIESYPEVKMTVSLADMIKEAHKTLHNADESYYSIPDSANKVSQLLWMLSSNDQQKRLVNTTSYQTGMIHAYLVSLSTDEIVQISNNIQNFVLNNSGSDVEVESSGLMILLKEFIGLVISSSIISIGVSIVAIFVISFLFFRKITWALMSIIPLSSAVILNFGLMGIFGVKLSHLTALLTAIIIGVGVDFAVHYISSFKRHLKDGKDINQISKMTMDDVGYPIMLDVVSNMGFGALLFSDLVPLNYMGGLMIFAMLSTSFGTFILMGTTMEIFKNRIYKLIG